MVRAPAILVALAMLSSLAACSPCREYCSEYQEALAGLTDPYATPQPGRQADHLRVAVAPATLEDLATGVASAIEAQIRSGIPAQIEVPLVGWRVTTDVSVRPSAFVVEPHPAGVGVALGLDVSVAMRLPSQVGGGSASLGGDVRIRTVGVVLEGSSDRLPALALRLSDSSLDRFNLRARGLGPVGRFASDLSRTLESLIREALRPEALGRLGDVRILELRPWQVDGATIRLAINRLDVEPSSGRLVIGLVTDLVTDRPPTSAPTPHADLGGIAVGLSPDLGGPLLASVLAADGGRRFGGDGGDDDEGPYGVLVTSLRPRRLGVDFDYRLYRFDTPCLVADFSGEADLAWIDDSPRALVRRNDLVYASRFSGAVERANPPVDRLSHRLTTLLGQSLTVESIVLPGAGAARLEPTGLTASERGYEVGWRLVR